MDKGGWMYVTTCPFCKRVHYQKEHLNTFCLCGAKYYRKNNEWKQRKSKQEG